MNIFSMMDDLIHNANKNYKSQGNNRWKYCVALALDNWRAYESEKVEGSDDIIIKWKKEGQENIAIRLSFIEQGCWIQYLENKKNDKG